MHPRIWEIWSIILIVITFISPVSAGTAPMAISANQKYFNTGVYSVNTISTFNNASAVAWNPLLYTVTYPATYGTISVALVFIALKNLHVQYTSGRISFYGIQSSITVTSFVFKLYSNFTSYIQLLEYSYLVVKNKYCDTYSMNSVTIVKNISSNISSSSSSTISLFLNSPFNTTGSIAGIVSFVGFDYVVTDSNNMLDLGISLIFYNDIYAQATIYAVGTVPVFVNTIHFDWVVFNLGFYNQPNFGSFTYANIKGTAGATGTSALQYINASNLYSASTMTGIWYIKIQGDNYIDFKININSPDNLSLTSTNAVNTFYLKYVMFFTYYCSYTSPYYYLANTTCYDACPVRTYQDENSLVCAICLFDCYTCGNDGSCSSCSDSDYRVLNTSTNRCVAAQGYYESGVTVAAACPIGCSVCNSSVICTQCSIGYSLNSSNFCQKDPCTYSCSGPPIGVIVGGVVGVVGLVLLILGSRRVYKWYRQNHPIIISEIVVPKPQSQQQGALAMSKFVSQEEVKLQVKSNDDSASNVNQISILQPALPGFWREKKSRATEKEQCSICYLERTFLRLNCSHYYHVKCIVDWSIKNQSCPCPKCRREGFDKQDHYIFCKDCRKKQKLIAFQMLAQFQQENKLNVEMVCDDCRIIPC